MASGGKIAVAIKSHEYELNMQGYCMKTFVRVMYGREIIVQGGKGKSMIRALYMDRSIDREVIFNLCCGSFEKG